MIPLTIRVAINGFGRIGRLVFRKMLEDPHFEIVAINSKYEPSMLKHLILYDTTHGSLNKEIAIHNDSLIIDRHKIKVVNNRNPSQLPWSTLKVDLVIEATGAFRTQESCQKHLDAGCSHVIITAPPKDNTSMYVMGVNHEKYNGERIISNASCTTNALAPLVCTIDNHFTIDNAFMTTIHAYTNDQVLHDSPHKDYRRARSATNNIIPTTTGAARAIGNLFPHLKGTIDGTSIRVPTPNVSFVNLVVQIQEKTTINNLNELFRSEAFLSPEIFGYSDKPLVSSDFIHDSRSTIVDGLSTMVTSDSLLTIGAWYDNEWGYSCRVSDLAKHIYTK